MSDEPSPNGDSVAMIRQGQQIARRAQIASALSDLGPSLTGRLRFARRAGFQYGRARDTYAAAGYIPQGEEAFEDYWGMYDRGAIAGKIVDMFPQTTWKTPPEIMIEGQGEIEPAFVKQFNETAKRLRLWHYLQRADRLSRIGQYGVLMIGTVGTDQKLSEEMPKLKGPEDILYLSAFHENDAAINTWVVDPSNERFGFPETYRLDLSSGVPGFKAGTEVVHWTRVIHVAEDLLNDEVHGRPALKRCLNRLMDLDKVCASTGEAFWQLAARILTGNIDPEGEIDGDIMDKMGESLEEMVHGLRRQFLGQGVDLSWLDSTPPDPSGAGDFFLSMIAAASGYPKRILFGSERGELASSQDERNYMGSVNERQEQHAEPNILRAFIDRIIDRGGFDSPGEAGYIVSWPPLFELDETQKAEVNVKKSETAKNLTPLGGDPSDLIGIDAEGDIFFRETLPRDPLNLDEEEDETDDPEGGEPGPDLTPPDGDDDGDETPPPDTDEDPEDEE